MNTNLEKAYAVVAVEKHDEFADHRNMWYFSSKCAVISIWPDEERAKKARENCHDSDRTIRHRHVYNTFGSVYGSIEASESLHTRHYVVAGQELAQFIVENSYSHKPQHSEADIAYFHRRVFGRPDGERQWGSGDGNPND
ncbi:MAG: hypothetical protein Q7R65_01435 [bacterium]|nr:hypothetical protein [bacterium]